MRRLGPTLGLQRFSDAAACCWQYGKSSMLYNFLFSAREVDSMWKMALASIADVGMLM